MTIFYAQSEVTSMERLKGYWLNEIEVMLKIYWLNEAEVTFVFSVVKQRNQNVRCCWMARQQYDHHRSPTWITH